MLQADTAASQHEQRRLSTLDRWLPVWIGLVTVAGSGPGARRWLAAAPSVVPAAREKVRA